jgi:glyoxylase-like metal-dependent hydrolase (beta-lactamase superfamily II)
LLVIDPLVPDDEPRFWDWLDGLASRRDRVSVVTTIQFHRRSRESVVKRYGASTSRAKDELPAGVLPLPIRGAGETMFWIAEHGALVAGDRLLNYGGGLRPCPASWMRYLPTPLDERELCARLRFLLDLPIEAILVSHGEPVLADAHRALARALGG